MPYGFTPKHAATRPLPFQPDGPNPAFNPVLLMIGHLIYLGRATGSAWVRQAPWLMGFLLFAQTARFASLLITSQISIKYPFFMMFGLSFGIITNIVFVILAIRSMSSYLGMTDEQTQPSIKDTLAATLIPFMVIYLAFGYVTNFTSDVLYLLTANIGFLNLADILSALNPISSTKAALETAGVFAATFLFGYLMTWVQNKTKASWPSLVSAFLSTVRWVLGVFSVFRIWEQVHLWLYGRQASMWWQQFVDWVSLHIHIDIPEIWSQIWSFFTTYVWHGMWDLVLYPMVWFALVIVVRGGQFLSANDVFERVLHIEQPGKASFLRRELIDRLPGDLDSRVFPILHALRETTRATMPFLGAFVVGFTLVTWAGDGLTRLISIIIGPRSAPVVMSVVPFVDLISSVLTMSLQIALLAVAFQRASQLAEMPKTPRATSIRQGIVLALVCAVLVASQGVSTQGLQTTVHTVSINSAGKSMGATVTLSNFRVGHAISGSIHEEATDRMFLVVTVAIQSDTSTDYYTSVEANGRTYSPYDFGLPITSTPAFRTSADYVFEISPADLQGPVFILVRPSTSVYMQKEAIRFRVDHSVFVAISDEPIPVNTSQKDDLP